jgi:hypothetical protein
VSGPQRGVRRPDRVRARETKGSPGKTSICQATRAHCVDQKTPPAWRSPTLNATCLNVLTELRAVAAELGFAEPRIPCSRRTVGTSGITRPMTSWRTAGSPSAGVSHVRFHDGQHTAITTLAEKGLPDWMLQPKSGMSRPRSWRPTATSGGRLYSVRRRTHSGRRPPQRRSGEGEYSDLLMSFLRHRSHRIPDTWVTLCPLKRRGMPWKECHVMDERLRFVARPIWRMNIIRTNSSRQADLGKMSGEGNA